MDILSIHFLYLNKDYILFDYQEYGTIQPYNIERNEPNSESGVHRDVHGKKEIIL